MAGISPLTPESEGHQEMHEPRPINLMTDDELRAQGWAAVARDADGHAMSVHAPFKNHFEKGKYIAREYDRGNSITKLQ